MALWDGVIAYWPMYEENPPFDNGVPLDTAVADISGNNNNALVGYDNSYILGGVSGILDTAFQTQTALAILHAPLDVEFEAQVFTLNLWMSTVYRYADPFYDYAQFIFSKWGSDTSWLLYISQESRTDKWMNFIVDVGGANKTAKYEIPYSVEDGYYPSLSTWAMVTCVFNGSTVKIYENSTEKDSVAAVGVPVSSPTTKVSLFNYFSSPASGYQFRGKACEAAMWNRALEPAEIIELYNGGDGLAYGTSASTEATGILGHEFMVDLAGASSVGHQFGVDVLGAGVLGHQFGVSVLDTGILGHQFAVSVSSADILGHIFRTGGRQRRLSDISILERAKLINRK